ncbi:MAG: hypothetical protein WDN01_17365 [Rhizomicrobium sp.]
MSDRSADAAPLRPEAERTLALTRLAAGAAQGLALYLLYRWIEDSGAAAVDSYRAVPLGLVFLFVPLLLVQGAGTLRVRTLVPWLVGVTALLAALGWYGVWRSWPPAGNGPDTPDAAMTFALLAASFVGLFIGQSLILAGDAERKFVAPYPAYFDAATKLGVQFAATVAFVAVFWGVLWLGAVLFNLIKLGFLEALLEKDWFAIPATALASAAAIHVTDVRAGLWTGIRTVALTLLSWLLPLMTLIAAGFTASLLFTGLTPLWATRSAAGLLLSAAGVVVVLLNMAFQDGSPEHSRARIFRYAEFVAALVLVPLVTLAAYAVWLRVAQYGWTVERVVTAATVLIALCYAFGYAAAALLSLGGGGWMRLVAPVNVTTAFAVIAVLLALFTPLGDPSRLAVSSQVARLKSGAVTANAFDYAYLKSEGGRYGHDALVRFASTDFGPATATVRKMAKAALIEPFQPAAPIKPAGPADLAANIAVYPKGAKLPDSFQKQDWHAQNFIPGTFVPDCLRLAGAKCDAVLVDLDGDGQDEILIADNIGLGGVAGLFRDGADGHWTRAGQIVIPVCAMIADALRNGQFTLVAPLYRDVAVGGIVLQVETAQKHVCG